MNIILTFYIIETPFNTFVNREEPDQAALVRASWSRSSLFAYGNMVRYDPTLAVSDQCQESQYLLKVKEDLS